jgi:tRNA1(Val) A37 N6-methylase TrmN6
MIDREPLAPGSEETLDELLRGRLRMLQPRRGPRVSLDGLLLAAFAARHVSPLGRTLDLGCGSGVIALALAVRDPTARLVGVELQAALAVLARRNARLNGVADRVLFVEGDLRRPRAMPLEPDAFDVCVANPPFHREQGGRWAHGRERALARQEITCTVDDVARAARRFLRSRGRLAVVFPADRLPALLGTLGDHGLRARVLRPVHSIGDEPAKRVLVLAAKDYKGGVTVEAPLVVHRADRKSYTDEAAEILGEPRGEP